MCAPGCASLGTPCHARSLHSASHTCTLLYNTLDTHAERLQVSLVILILHTHVHVHIGATLLGQSCVCCQSARSRATGSRMHARGMFACALLTRASRGRALTLLWADLS